MSEETDTAHRRAALGRLGDERAVRRQRRCRSSSEWKPALAVAGLIPPEADENGKYESAREHGTHALRHFYASALLDAGENIKAIS